MTRAVYVIGGAGTGKSTFMAELLNRLGVQLEPLGVLWEGQIQKKAGPVNVRLRGQSWPGGVYLGVLRPEFPGTDGLDNACLPVARDWLDRAELPPLILGEGMLMGTQSFLPNLARAADLMVAHLVLPEEERLRRVSARGHEFNPVWSAQTVTRARNGAQSVAGLATVRVNPSVEEAVLHTHGV